MKKEYKSPSMEVIEMKMQQGLLAGSGDKIGGGSAGGGSQLSREEDFFDDEILDGGGLFGF